MGGSFEAGESVKVSSAEGGWPRRMIQCGPAEMTNGKGSDCDPDLNYALPADSETV